MAYGSRELHLLALSTFTENRMPHKDEASEGLKTAMSSEAINISMKTQGKGPGKNVPTE